MRLKELEIPVSCLIDSRAEEVHFLGCGQSCSLGNASYSQGSGVRLEYKQQELNRRLKGLSFQAYSRGAAGGSAMHLLAYGARKVIIGYPVARTPHRPHRSCLSRVGSFT